MKMDMIGLKKFDFPSWQEIKAEFKKFRNRSKAKPKNDEGNPIDINFEVEKAKEQMRNRCIESGFHPHI